MQDLLDLLEKGEKNYAVEKGTADRLYSSVGEYQKVFIPCGHHPNRLHLKI